MPNKQRTAYIRMVVGTFVWTKSEILNNYPCNPSRVCNLSYIASFHSAHDTTRLTKCTRYAPSARACGVLDTLECTNYRPIHLVIDEVIHGVNLLLHRCRAQVHPPSLLDADIVQHPNDLAVVSGVHISWQAWVGKDWQVY